MRLSSKAKREQSKCHTSPRCVRVSVTENFKINT